MKKKMIALMLAPAILLGGANLAASQVHAAEASSTPSVYGNSASSKAIKEGVKYMGIPYEFGSSRSNTRTFDCSDFVRHAYKEGAGITLPKDSRKQAAYVKKIGKTTANWRNLKVGDLMFFMSYKGSSKSDYAHINKFQQRITHVGIYLGNGRILHTYSVKSGGVRIDHFKGKPWEYRFVFGGTPY